MVIVDCARAAGLAAALAALLAAGCESVRPPMAGVAVADVQVQRSATVTATALPAGLRESMMAIVPGCAGEGVPHNALVRVLAFRHDRDAGGRPGHGASLTGEVNFAARGGERRAGPFRISVSTAGTSLATAPAGNPDSVLSNLFAAAVCREVFRVAPAPTG